MFLLFRGLPVLIEICLFVYCLIDAIQTPSDEVRNLPKVTWVVLIILVPFIGSVAWLAAGRPTARRQSAWAAGSGFPEYERPRAPRSYAPDDDPAFLAQLRKVDDEHRDALRRWEEDLRQREGKMRAKDDEPDGIASA